MADVFAPEPRPAVGTFTGSAAAAVVAVPGGTSTPVVGDLLLMLVENNGSDAETTVDNGWTIVPGSAQVNGGTRASWWYKIATGSDTATIADMGDHQAGRIMAIRAGTFDPDDIFNNVAVNTQASTTSVSAPGLTTDRDFCLIVAGSVGDLPDANGFAEFSSEANADLTGVTERFDSTTAAGNGGAMWAMTGVKAAAGSVGASTVTAVNAAARAGSTLAINPFPGVVIRGVGTIATNTIAVSPGLPTGTVAGDLLLMFIETLNGQAVTVSGWTALGGDSPVEGTGERITVFYKIAAGGDATTTSDSGDHQNARIVGIVAGSFDSSDPFGNDMGSGTQGSTTAVSIPGLTTDENDSLVLAFNGCNNPDANTSSEFSAWANTNLYAIQELIDNTGTAGSGTAIGVAAGWDRAAGSVGATTATAVTAGTRACISFSVNPLPSTIFVTLTPATETDTAQVLSKETRVVITPAAEADTAQVLNVDGVVTLTPATEVDTGQPLDLETRATLVPATESDTAVELDYPHPIRRDLTPASEADTAQALDVDKHVTLPQGAGAGGTPVATRIGLGTGNSFITTLDAEPGRVFFGYENFDSSHDTAILSMVDDGPGLTWEVDVDVDSSGNNRHAGMVSAYAPAGMPAGTELIATWGGNGAPDFGCTFEIVGVSNVGETQYDTFGEESFDETWDLDLDVTGDAILVAFSWIFSFATITDLTSVNGEVLNYQLLSGDTVAAGIVTRHTTGAGTFTVDGTWEDSNSGGTYVAAAAYNVLAGGAELPGEVDSAQPLDVETRVTLTPGAEADTAVALDISQEGPIDVDLTPATEADTAQALDVETRVNLTPASEADTAQPLDFETRVVLVPATEADTARPLDVDTRVVLVPASEADSAQVLDAETRVTLTPATSSNTAQPLDVETRVTLTPATETDQAFTQTADATIRVDITPALETDTAQALDADTHVVLVPATEADAAQALSVFTRVTLGVATEVDTAQVLSIVQGILVTLVPALEIDTAIPLVISFKFWPQGSGSSWPVDATFTWPQHTDDNWED